MDEYVPQVIDLLRTISPKEVCSAIKSCPLSRLELLRQWALGAKEILVGPRTVSAKLALAEQYVENSFPQECIVCRFVVSQAAKKLKDPANQVLPSHTQTRQVVLGCLCGWRRAAVLNLLIDRCRGWRVCHCLTMEGPTPP